MTTTRSTVPRAPLIGLANEVDINVCDVNTVGLLDTGSQVTSVAKSFVDQHLSDLEIEPVDKFVEVRGVSGQRIGLLGIVVVDLHIPAENISSGSVVVPTPALVVEDTLYNRQVPFIVGTNVLKVCRDSGRRFSSVWQKAISIVTSQQQTVSSDDFLGSVICTKQLKIAPFSIAVINGMSRIGPIGKHLVISEEGDYATLPNGLSLVSSAQYLSSNSNASTRCKVEVHNLTTTTITVPSRTQLCMLSSAKVVCANHVASPENCVSFQQSATENEDCSSFLEGFKIHETDLDPDQRQKLEHLLLKWKHIFASNDLDLGHTNTVTHSINMTDETPFRERYRRIPPTMYQEVRDHVQEMLDCGVIRLSKSPFASPVVLIRKKDGRLRFCIDYRQLNSKTVKDAHALPRIDETLDTLNGSTMFSALDLKAGYWQVEVDEKDKHKTAFTAGPLGFFEYNRMPFGLVNAPATFQRLMTVCMQELNLSQCLLYLDDIIIFSKGFDEHLQRLENVLQRLADNGLKLTAKKCTFCQKKVKYLGHIVSEDGVQTDPEKIQDVLNWPVPPNLKALRRFLGFTGFYRRFVKDYSRIARPLYDLLKLDTKQSVKGKSRAGQQLPWEGKHQQSFQELVRLLTTAPVLAYANYTEPCIVHTDASRDGLGAILYQQHEGKLRVISFASQGYLHQNAIIQHIRWNFWPLSGQLPRSFAITCSELGSQYVLTTPP